MKRASCFGRLGVLALTWLAFGTPISWSQKGPGNPLAPTLNVPTPSGAQRGTTIDLTLTGGKLANPTGLLIGDLGVHAKFSLPKDGKNGQDNSKVVYKLEVGPNAPIGIYPLRVSTPGGVSNLKLFCIDDLPQVAEDGKNNARTTAQNVPVPCVIMGRTEAENSDFYKLTVKPGQRLSFELLARRLGSTLDAQITLYEAKSRRELAYANDSLGCQGDPRTSYTFKDGGEYLVEVRDVLNRGGGNFDYRLRIGDFPLATAPFPMAAKRGSKAKIQFVGPSVDGVPAQDVAVPADPTVNALWLAPVGPSGLSGWPVALLLTDTDEAVEQEPNNDAPKANRIALPAAISGRFVEANDLDSFVFAAKKGQKYFIEAQTLELYSPTLVYMVVKDAKGAELAKSNPGANPPADQRFDFTAPADGDFILEVQHLNYLSGPAQVYRLMVTPPTPSFELTLGSDQVDLVPGSQVPVVVQVSRQGYAGPVELALVGAPQLVGTGTIRAGQKSGILRIEAKPGTPLGPHLLKVQGKATIEGKQVLEFASVRGQLSQDLANLTYPPLTLNYQFAGAVAEKGPITLTAKLEHAPATAGIPLTVTLVAQREKGYDADIVINPPAGLPANVPAPKVPNIPKGKNEVTFKLDLNAKAPEGDYVLLFSGKTKKDPKDKAEVATGLFPVVLSVGDPFELKVQPEDVTITPGAKVALKVVATRLGGYKGPINLEIRKLPPMVTGTAKVVIAPDKSEATLEISADAKAAPVERVVVDVNGVATALNNRQAASGPINLKINKK